MASNRTRNQDQILQTLQSLNREIAAQELYIYLQENGHKVGLATVYRSLDVLKQQGEIQVRTLESGISMYSSIQRDRHHLNCVKCGKAEIMDECPLHDLEQKLSPGANFKVFNHTLEFYGLCYSCQASEAEDDHSPCTESSVKPVNSGASHPSSPQSCC